MKSLNVLFPESRKIEIVYEDVPEPNDDQILCRAERTIISIGTEMRCLIGESDPGTNWRDWVKFPFYPGYCMTGSVIKVGKNVTDYKVGDRVSTQNTHRQYFLDTPGQQFLVRVPDKVTFAQAAWQVLGNITQLGVRRGGLIMGENVGVIGLGMLGQLCTQYIKLSGARKIIAIDTNAHRLELARKCGATDVFRGDVADSRDFIVEATNGKLLDVVLDITGLPQVLAPATTLLRQLGSVVLLGDNVKPSQQYLGPRVLVDSINILGAFGGTIPEHDNYFNPWTWKKMAELFYDYVQDGRLDVDVLTTDVVSPLKAIETYEWLLNDRPDTVGVQFDWTKL